MTQVTHPFPYAPRLVKELLKANLPNDIRLATKVPATMPAKLITIESAPLGGGGTSNVALSWRRLIIQSWNSDEQVAGLLIEDVRQILVDAPRLGNAHLRGVAINAEPGRFDDPDTGQPRFQMLVDVLLRATPKT